MLTLTIAATVTAVIAVLIFIPVTMKVYIRYDDNGTDKSIEVRYGAIKLRKPSFKRKKKETPAGAEGKKERSDKIINRLKQLWENADDLWDMVKALGKYVKNNFLTVKYMAFSLVVGVDDPMATALIYGAASAVVYNAAVVAERELKVKKHDIAVMPDFDNPHIYGAAEAIIKTNVFHCFAVLNILMYHLLKIKSKKIKNRKGKI